MSSPEHKVPSKEIFYSFMSGRESNKFFLEEKAPHGEGINFGLTIAVFSDKNIGTLVGNLSSANPNMLEVYSKILRIKIPQRIQKLEMAEDEALAERNKKRLSLMRMPYLLLAFGKIANTEKDVAALYVVPGMTPEKALGEIKNFAARKLASFN
ncbi:MAG: hypothetical protein Q8P26_05680 [Candidatus Levybacteria bacterium]|nr:hypothetical protein [Candidatus Levybacteria bacterium]